jgi:hypothetical protein
MRVSMVLLVLFCAASIALAGNLVQQDMYVTVDMDGNVLYISPQAQARCNGVVLPPVFGSLNRV